MRFSSDSAQVDPLAALAAVFAVVVALSLYVGALDSTLPALSSDREMAATATDRFLSEASSFGVVDTPLKEPTADVRPTGYSLNATLRADEISWDVGPVRPEHAECERRSVSAQVAPGRVDSGFLEVCVWPAE